MQANLSCTSVFGPYRDFCKLVEILMELWENVEFVKILVEFVKILVELVEILSEHVISSVLNL